MRKCGLFLVIILFFCFLLTGPAQAEGRGANVVKSFFTLVGRPITAPFYAVVRVVDGGGSPLRWVNNAVRSLREDTLDVPVDAVKFLASPAGVEPTPLDGTGEINQAISSAGPVAEAVADAAFAAVVTGVVQHNRPKLFGGHHHAHKWEKAAMAGAGISLGSQAIDPATSNHNSRGSSKGVWSVGKNRTSKKVHRLR